MSCLVLKVLIALIGFEAYSFVRTRFVSCFTYQNFEEEKKAVYFLGNKTGICVPENFLFLFIHCQIFQYLYFANSCLLNAGDIIIMAAFCLDTCWHTLLATDEKEKNKSFKKNKIKGNTSLLVACW